MKAATQTIPRQKTALKMRRKATIFSCPADAIGWCPYPFSPAQLKRHLKKLATGVVSEGQASSLIKSSSLHQEEKH